MLSEFFLWLSAFADAFDPAFSFKAALYEFLEFCILSCFTSGKIGSPLMPLDPLLNFTPRAQQVLALARKEADRLHHDQVRTEHFLLGIIKLGQGPGAAALLKMGLDLEAVRAAITKEVGIGPETNPQSSKPFSFAAKKTLALAGKEAKSLNHSYLGTEHILLGLLREDEGTAARLLKSFGVDLERTRKAILDELSPGQSSAAPSDERTPP